MNIEKLKGWVILVVSIFLVFFFLPYAYWSNHTDSKNLETRGKQTKSKVINVKGLKRTNITIKYEVDGQVFEQVVTAPSLHKPRRGDSLAILYDSLDYENIKVLW